ncbi:hypothetical protein BFP78_04890 [Gaetbulibacter sp. 5U11]|nr:hypothetical protein BFP78_04890 [Gaetbulibacter sp. 5U11]
MKKIIVLVNILLFVSANAQTTVLKTADSLYNYGNFSKAIAFYNQLDNPLDYADKIAKSYYYIGNYDQAIDYYNKALLNNPNNQLIKFEQCKLLFQNGQLAKAKIHLLDLIKADQSNPNYYYFLGLVGNASDNFETAQDNFLKAYQLDQTHQNAIFELAKYSLQKRAFKKVEDYVNKGLESYPNNKKLIGLIAQKNYLNNEYHESISQFLKLLDLGETTKFVYEKLGYCYGKVYYYSKAIKYLDLALKSDPKDANNHYLLGINYEQIRKYDLAEKHVLEAIKLLDQPLDEQYAKLGVLYNLQDKPAEAIQAFNNAIKENPKSESNYFFRTLTKLDYFKDLDAKQKEVKKFNNQFPDSKYSEILNLKLAKFKSEKFQNKTE